MNGVVGTDLVCQVGFIVKDINATKKKWAEFLGVEEPEAALCGEYETTQTVSYTHLTLPTKLEV